MAKKADDDLGIVNSSGLTDVDWAEINKLKSTYGSGGQKALSAALDALIKDDPVRATRVLGAFFPDMVREAIKDQMAENGITEEDPSRANSEARESGGEAIAAEVGRVIITGRSRRA